MPDSTRADAAAPAAAAFQRPPEGAHPPLLYPDYRSTVLRAPSRPLRHLPHTLTEVTGPVLGEGRLGELDHDLTRQHDGEPLGERVIVHGRVLEGDGRPVPHTLVEIWQANACGRY
ncbi:MAG: protocatechuate 3,4-dioxygenase, beta subunit, partial [Solirubrobacteraceae bacterium]|nr:protocatechuate 3,4-dioxygenase, beta subunit [Solirubrobacteraceae bacterium]